MSLVAYASSDESEPDEPEPELEEEDVAAPMPRPTFSPCTQRSSLAAPAPQMLTPTFPPPLLLPSPIRDPRLQPSPPLPFGFRGFLPPTGVSPAEAPRIGEGLGLPSPQGPGLSLPPAVGSVGTPLRLPKPKKRTKPVRIAAPELHKDDSDSEEDEPAKKKIVLQGSSKETGLSALLPQPENLTVKETNRLLLLHAFSRKPSDVSSDAKPSRLASKTKPASLAPVFGTTTTTPSPSAIKAAARSAALQVTQEDDDSDEEVAPEKFFPSLTRLSHLELSHTLTLSSLSLKSCLQARNQSQLSRTMRPIAPLEFKMTAGSSGGPWMPKPRDDYSYNQFSTYDNANAAGAYYQDYYSGGCYPAPDLALVPPQEIAPDASFIDDESFKRLQGKRNRVREEINFVEIKCDDQLSGAQQWMTKSLTEEKTMKSFSTKKGEQPTGRQRRKHQTTYLIHQAEEQEQELELGLKNIWSENTLSRCQIQAKYGF